MFVDPVILIIIYVYHACHEPNDLGYVLGEPSLIIGLIKLFYAYKSSRVENVLITLIPTADENTFSRADIKVTMTCVKWCQNIPTNY